MMCGYNRWYVVIVGDIVVYAMMCCYNRWCGVIIYDVVV